MRDIVAKIVSKIKDTGWDVKFSDLRNQGALGAAYKSRNLIVIDLENMALIAEYFRISQDELGAWIAQLLLHEFAHTFQNVNMLDYHSDREYRLKIEQEADARAYSWLNEMGVSEDLLGFAKQMTADTHKELSGERTHPVWNGVDSRYFAVWQESKKKKVEVA